MHVAECGGTVLPQNLDSSEISLTDVSHYFDSDPTKLVSGLRGDGKMPSSYIAGAMRCRHIAHVYPRLTSWSGRLLCVICTTKCAQWCCSLPWHRALCSTATLAFFSSR